MITKEIRSRWEAEAQAWALEQDADVDVAAAVAGARRLVDAILGGTRNGRRKTDAFGNRIAERPDPQRRAEEGSGSRIV